MKRYVVGFMFDAAFARVALIQKERPEWQKGRLNGIGGKVEPDEHFLAAMQREFMEETGLAIREQRPWHQIATLRTSDGVIEIFATVGPVDQLRSVTDEAVHVVPVKELPRNALPNVRWLVPLSVDVLNRWASDPQHVLVTYGDPDPSRLVSNA